MSATIATMMKNVGHKIFPRDANERVVLRSSHGKRKMTINAIVGTTIAASISTQGALACDARNGMWLKSHGTKFSSPKRKRKYHAGYGMNAAFVGSAFASRIGRREDRQRQDDDEDEERRRAVHEHLIRPEASGLEFARIVDDRTGRAVVTEDREMRGDQ